MFVRAASLAESTDVECPKCKTALAFFDPCDAWAPDPPEIGKEIGCGCGKVWILRKKHLLKGIIRMRFGRPIKILKKVLAMHAGSCIMSAE